MKGIYVMNSAESCGETLQEIMEESPTQEMYEALLSKFHVS